MKNLNYTFLFIITLTFLLSCQPDQTTITVSNNSNIDLETKVITVERLSISNIPADKFPLVIDAEDTLVSQVDDLDQDGTWDELAFMVDIKANQEKQVQLLWVNDIVTFKPRTNIRFAKKTEDGSYNEMITEVRPEDHTKASPTVTYQMEGPAWENDKVGFRMYFDPRNGFDIFGKTTDEMVLDQVGIKGNYHELQDWGMDILKVNNSLGAGALALQWQDSLYRLSTTDEAQFQLISEGPVRSIFALIYKGWQVGEDQLDLTQRITIEAGNYFYKSNVAVNNLPENAHLATGIVNIKADTMYQENAHGMKILATHAPQAFAGEQLGMAILADEESAMQVMKAPETGNGISQTYVYVFQPALQPVSYYFMAGWELTSDKFASKNGFLEAATNAAAHIATGVEVSIN